ncbi:alcohol oxidase [Pluteus cervinus]|uniref:Alcohol oxidase n=1 Tax=Pluteus cervinus TaxID=181527 RepID=A0ACD3B853_9AGAR|nr:alcohol oxidase [Pluteus cervinus]
MSDSLDTIYDIIFAGGGASGCLVAGRLAKADPSLKILIVEQGEHTKDKPAHIQPARYFSHLAPTSKTVTFNVGKPSEHVGNRSIVIPSGRCLGGGSSVNFAMYTRAATTDYDDWESEFGNEGWSSKHLIPLLKKTETYQVKEGEATHGYTGPLKVSWGGTFTNVGEQFLDVAAKYDQERGTIDDINGLHECNEYGRWQKWINGETGTRSDVPHHFIYNQGENKNLHILTGQKVKRVIFEGIRAVGVEYVRDKTLDSQADQTVRTARASKLVVVSAGAFGSPTILERSGIGGARVLGEVGIDVKVDLPGVGQNYQDHNFVPAPYLASEDAETLDGIFRGDATAEEENLKLFAQGKGLIAHNGLDAGIKLRPTPHDLQELGPEFESRWRTFFANKVDKPVIWLGPFSCYIGDPSTAPIRKYYTIGYYTQYPVSRGSVHISSKDDPHAPHDFDPGFLTDPADVATLQWGYKKSRELARRMGVYRGEYLPGHPKFAARSPALCSDDAVGPVPIDTPDIQYTEEDEEVIETYNRNFVQTAWHSLGTCAMKPRGAGGVVDSRLNVYGVEGLKVADISIAPQNVGANTYSTALVIGEKAAVIIAEELGIADF